MKKIVNRQTVEHVARTARLSLLDKEKKEMESDLNEILGAFRVLDKAPVKELEPSFHPVPMQDALREDAVENGFSPAMALGNTEHKERGFYKGPKAI